MRLIDADILKEAFIVNTDRKGYLVADPEVIIDNAPTVSKKELQKIFYETAEKPELKEVLAYECGMNNDLISREALREAFHKRIYYFDKSSWDEANALIDNATTVEYPFYQEAYQTGYEEGRKDFERPKGKWIPVSERLPDWWEVVLVTDESGKVYEYERRITDGSGNVCEEWSFLGRKIIAWMPLPEPYKEGGADMKIDPNSNS